MKNMRLIVVLIPVVLVSVFSGPLAASPSESVGFTAAGSGVNLGITRLLVQAYEARHPGVTISIPGSIGSKGAIAAIKDRAITFGLISRPLKETETSPEYEVLAYAQTPIVIGVNMSVSETAISSQELVDIFSGKKAQWTNGQEIIVQIREAFDSGFSEVEKKVKGFKEVCDESRRAGRWITYYTDQDANQALSKTPNAIGVTDLGMIASERLQVRPLAFNGVMPSAETLINGQYPLTRELYFLYRPQTLPEEAKAFLAFIRSDEAKTILKEHGYIPLAQ